MLSYLISFLYIRQTNCVGVFGLEYYTAGNMKIDSSKLFASLAFPLVVGFSSSFVVLDSTTHFFDILVKPPLTPPAWVFGPAWTILYIMIGLALYKFWTAKAPSPQKQTGYLFFLLQIIANFLWTLFFFGLHSPLLGLIDILILVVLIAVNFFLFRRINKASGYLLLPYLIWTLFATYLNIGIWILN